MEMSAEVSVLLKLILCLVLVKSTATQYLLTYSMVQSPS